MAKERKTPPSFRAYDSELGETYPEHRIYAVAYEPYWQWLRHGLHWLTHDDAVASLAKVDAYLMTSPAEELPYRAWRVYNLLCAIPHGQVTVNEIPIVERSTSKLLFAQTEKYRRLSHDVGYPSEWDWAPVRHTANTMPRDALEAPLDYILEHRARHITPKPELRHYVKICLDALGREAPPWLRLV